MTSENVSIPLDRPSHQLATGPAPLHKADHAIRRMMDTALVKLTNERGAQTQVKITVLYEVTKDIPGSEK